MTSLFFYVTKKLLLLLKRNASLWCVRHLRGDGVIFSVSFQLNLGFYYFLLSNIPFISVLGLGRIIQIRKRP